MSHESVRLRDMVGHGASSERSQAAKAYAHACAERDGWIRSWNRLEAAISHHKKDKSAMFVDEVDEALYAARDRILKERAGG